MTLDSAAALNDDISAEQIPSGPPLALHRGASDLPFVRYQEGVTFQLNQVNIEAGYFVVRLRGEPGTTIQQHKHTGEIFAFTLAGSWRYLEYPEINTVGSYLYEPAIPCIFPKQTPRPPTSGLSCTARTSTSMPMGKLSPSSMRAGHSPSIVQLAATGVCVSQA
jgi:hypothetical protein